MLAGGMFRGPQACVPWLSLYVPPACACLSPSAGQQELEPSPFGDCDCFTPLRGVLPQLWALWELLLLGQPLMVVAPTPGECASLPMKGHAAKLGWLDHATRLNRRSQLPADDGSCCCWPLCPVCSHPCTTLAGFMGAVCGNR